MRIRRVLIALFALGTLAGYGSAIAAASCHAHARCPAFGRRDAPPCAESQKDAASTPRDEPRTPW